MKQDYLTPFLKHLSLTLPTPSRGVINGGSSDDIQIPANKDPLVELVGGGDTTTDQLATMIINAIKSGLSKSDKYLQDQAKRKKKIRADKNKIKGITMANGIDMNYGGGILVFGPNFQIKQMIHMFYDQETKPMYFSTPVQARMDDDVVNKNIKNKPKPYTSAKIAQEIKKIFQ
jgi:hypothetical protein